jgi:MFS family permease
MWTRAEALRHPVFWLMVPALMGPAAWNTAYFFHQVHLAEAKGWAHVSLVSLFPLYTAASVGTMLTAGWLVDRFGSLRLGAFYLLPLAAGYVTIALAGPVPAGALAMMLIGAGQGMHVTMMATFWAEVFGTRHLGAIRAMMGAVMVLGTAIGPGVTGAIIDLGVEFPRQGYGIAVYFLLASLMAGMAGRLARRGR